MLEVANKDEAAWHLIPAWAGLKVLCVDAGSSQPRFRHSQSLLQIALVHGRECHDAFDFPADALLIGRCNLPFDESGNPLRHPMGTAEASFPRQAEHFMMRQ